MLLNPRQTLAFAVHLLKWAIPGAFRCAGYRKQVEPAIILGQEELKRAGNTIG